MASATGLSTARKFKLRHYPFFEALAAMSTTAHLVQMFDSTVVRAHVSAAGAKGGKAVKPSAGRAAVFRQRFT